MKRFVGLNAPTGAWCSLTAAKAHGRSTDDLSQCTYRCVVLPDLERSSHVRTAYPPSQCTYRCVVLPDLHGSAIKRFRSFVSMHLQVRGAP